MEIQHLENEKKIVAIVEGKEAYLLYKLEDGILDFYSTFVPKEGRGMGLARKLTEVGLQYSRDNGFTVLPTCSYVESLFDKTPELNDLDARKK